MAGAFAFCEQSFINAQKTEGANLDTLITAKHQLLLRDDMQCCRYMNDDDCDSPACTDYPDSSCKNDCRTIRSTASVFSTTGALVAAATACACLSIVIALVGFSKIGNGIYIEMHMCKLARTTCLLAFILGLAAILVFSGGCGCPEAQLLDNDGEATLAAKKACGIIYDSKLSTMWPPHIGIGDTPENEWCAVPPASKITTSQSNGDVVKSWGKGTAFNLCIVGLVFELFDVIVFSVLIRSSAGGCCAKVKPATSKSTRA